MVNKSRQSRRSALADQYRRLLIGRGVRQFDAGRRIRTQVLFENLNANLRKLMPVSETFVDGDMQKLRGKVDSSRVAKWRIQSARKLRRGASRFSSRAKFSLINQVFGGNGQRMGILMVKPELFAYASKVRKYLNDLGFEVVLAKNVVFDKQKLQMVYGKEFGAYPEFPIQAANLISGPSKVLVFRQKSAEEMLQSAPFAKHLQQSDPRAYTELVAKLKGDSPAVVFDKLLKGAWQGPQPGTIRKEVTYPRLEEIGVRDMSGLARLLDPHGYFRKRIKKGAKTVSDVAYYQLTSVHIPSTVEELFNDADAFFTRAELAKLKNHI
jgi:hypothetical protein